ncbi:glycosyltransferase [Agromyces sp. H3Y2-19a]|uniref:glycosyltransferase n=1 Tax=Agromyces chromiiresistens TaxID=3030835 RepID=UPI0023B91082|nr:glycosyltransferase [Agromyces chromiiresistens]MDF0514639.1 glycosyltransferase [Agromyces chromiiresistens]
MPSAPAVDVVIAVHDPSRPLARAVRSVLHDRVEGVRVLVVCHGIPVAAFDDVRREFDEAPVVWLEFTDGVRSPTGPFMHGLRTATAEYVTIMGSDDFMEPGAVAAAVDHLRADRPDALVLPLMHQSGEILRNPLARKGHVRHLDPIRDRLAYRTAPLAYLRRSMLGALDLVLTPEMPAGNDIEFSAKLWYSGARIDFHPADPSYVIGADADTRVTTAPRPARLELTALRLLLTRDWLVDAPAAVRTSLMIKVLRIHVLGPVLRRASGGALAADDIDAYAEVVRTAVGLAPRARRPFARADRDLLDALVSDPHDRTAVAGAAAAHPTAGRFARLIPRNPFAVADREGAIRRFLRYRSWP